jgi:DNA-binding MarR family transcriptional regulator
MTGKSRQNRLTAGDYRALAEFRYRLRQFLLFSEKAARECGLQPRQHQALLAIKGGGGVTVGQLAERLGIKPHSAAELTNRLVAARLVRRIPDTSDRRRSHLALTPAAERRLEDLALVHRAELKRLAGLLGPLFKALSANGTL